MEEMALDFHIASLRKAAYESTPDLSIDLHLHNKIFTHVDVNDLRMLRKLREYYADAEFIWDDLPTLQSEVNMLGDRSSDHALKTFLATFSKIIKKAYTEQKSLFVFSD